MTAQPALAVLREIWQQVLEVDNIKDTDNFFDLGGDSFLAIEAASIARERGLDVLTSAVLRRPVLAELAAAATGTPDGTDLDDSEGRS
jgi:aryl carrier-like protein